MTMDGVALVTGGASGIGLATCKAFVAKGVKRLAVVDLPSDALQAAVSALSKDGVQAIPVPCDVADEASVQAMVQEVVKAFGRVDYAVNCAGVGTGGAFGAMSAADYDRVININQRGVFLCLREQVNQMAQQDPLPSRDERRAQRGAIVNTSSVLGQSAIPGVASYVASKHAVVGLAKSVAVEYGQLGIRCNNVAPGWIATPMTVNPQIEGILKTATAPGRTAMARSGMPEEVADVIVFLCSEEASFVTGATWNVDGGYKCY